MDQQENSDRMFRLPIVVEQVDGSYQATSPLLPGFLVLADTLEDLLALAPGAARTLLLAMEAKGATPSIPTEELRFPAQVEILVPVGTGRTAAAGAGVEKLPQFADEQEEAAFWDTHDSTEFLEETEPVDVVFEDARPPKQQS